MPDIFDQIEAQGKKLKRDLFDEIEPVETGDGDVFDRVTREAVSSNPIIRTLLPSSTGSEKVDRFGRAMLSGTTKTAAALLEPAETLLPPLKLAKASETLKNMAALAEPEDKTDLEEVIAGGPEKRKVLSEKLLQAPTEESIEKKAFETKQVPMGDIFLRSLAEGVSEAIPTNPLELALFLQTPGINRIATGLAEKLGLGKTNAFNLLKGEVIKKFTQKGVPLQEAEKMAEFGLRSAMKGGGVEDITASQLRQTAKGVKRGQKIILGEAETNIPHGTISEGPRPPSQPSPAGVAPSSAVEPKAPPISRIDETTLGKKTIRYVEEKYPLLAEAVKGQEIPIEKERLSGIVTESIAKGEEALLRGGTPEISNREAVQEFMRRVRDVVPPSPPQEPPTGIPRPEGRPPIWKRREPKVYTDRFALRRSLQRQATAAREAKQFTVKELTGLKTEVARNISELLPETERGEYLESLAKINTPAQAEQLITRLLKRSQIVGVEGARTITEKEALRQSLQRQAFAAAQAATETTKNLTKLKSGIVASIKDELPLSDRGRFLSMIASAKNSKDVVKALNRLDQEVEKVQRKNLINSIKREFQRVQASNMIAIDYKNRVGSLMQDILFQKPRKETLRKVLDLENYIRTKRKAGEDVGVPEYVLDRLKVLNAVPLSELKTAAIKDILIEMKTLADIGKAKLRARQDIDALNKGRDLDDLTAGTVSLESVPLQRPGIGEDLAFKHKVVNLLAKASNLSRRVNNAITPMDPLFDTLDGSQNYEGPNYRIFKARVDNQFSAYLDEGSRLKREGVSKGKYLTKKNRERIGVYAIAQQEGGIEKLGNLGITEEEVKGISLTPEEQAFYNFIRSKFDEIRPRIAQIMKNVYNADLGEVKNYFPFMTDYELMPEEFVGDQILKQMIGYRKNVPMGFTKERKGSGEQRVNIDALDVYLKHMDDVAYLLNMGSTIKYLGELANSPAYQQIAGDVGGNLVREWIDTLAKKGAGVGSQQIRLIDLLRTNLGAATLAFKLSSALVQVTPVGNAAGLIGQYAFKGAMDYGTSKRWREFVNKNMPELRERSGDDPAYAEIAGTGRFPLLTKAGFWALKSLDETASKSVAIGAYQKYLRDKNLPLDFENPNQDGISYAQRVVRRTQSSPYFKDSPLAITRGKLTANRSLDRAIFQFQTYALNEWSLLKHEGFEAGIKKDRYAQAFNLYLWATLMAMAGTGIRMGAKEAIDSLTGDEKETKGTLSEEFLKGITKEIISKVPFVSQAMSVINYGAMPVPILDVVKRGGEGVKSLAVGKSLRTKVGGAIKTAGAAGRVAGIPGTTQVEELLRKSVVGKMEESEKKAQRRKALLND